MHEASHTLNRPLRIVVADDDPADCRFYMEHLPSLGHQAPAVVHTGKDLIEQCRATRFDLAIIEMKLPDMDGVAASLEVCQRDPLPVVMVASVNDFALIEKAVRDHVLAYLSKPVKLIDLGVAILLAARRFEQIRGLEKEAADLRKTLAERKVIERAKGVVMKRLNLDETEAYRRLQRMASSKNLKVADIAQTLLAAEQAFEVLEKAPNNVEGQLLDGRRRDGPPEKGRHVPAN